MNNINRTSNISRRLGKFSDSIINRHSQLRTGTALGIACASALLLQAPETHAQIAQPAADTPIITKGWDPFTSGTKVGFGRWGMFMEPSALTLGIPAVDNPWARFQVARYRKDGSRDMLMAVEQSGWGLSLRGLANVPSVGDEQPFLSGQNGYVAIGSLNPKVKELAVRNVNTGTYMNVSVGSLTIRGGADLAEPFPISSDKNTQELAPGSVVVIDPEKPGHLKKSGQAYDTRVAGVISGAGGVHPGIQLKQEGVLEAGQNVALTGRVYVQADASNAEITPGDLLTTSDTPGHAMKVTHHDRSQGAILGKAMTSLKEGKGLVLVLVSLQ